MKHNKQSKIERYPIPSLAQCFTSPNLTEHTIENFRQLHEELIVPDGVNKTKKAIREVKKMGFVIGTKAKISNDDEAGVIVGYNNNTDGFYPGSRYPILVKFERGTFEYAPDDLKLVQ